MGEKQLRCPRRPIYEDPALWSEMFWLHAKYTEGMLPEEGALLSQPYKLYRYLRLIDGIRATLQREEREDAEKKRQREARKGRTSHKGRRGSGRRRR